MLGFENEKLIFEARVIEYNPPIAKALKQLIVSKLAKGPYRCCVNEFANELNAITINEKATKYLFGRKRIKRGQTK
jgi:hypothetical protein